MTKFIFTILTLMIPLASFAQEEEGFQKLVNDIFGVLVGIVAPVLFFPVPFIQLPFIVFIMVAGGIFFTFRLGFVNFRLFKHALQVTAGKYDNPEDKGQITSFQALTSALSATVGLGNIAGVAVAIQMGGPGAVFWLWVSAFFGMSLKFSECSFAQVYRDIDKEDGSV